ncbi:MAG: hypothetical protein ACJASV_000007 [Pseudorhodobacter sp.]|jgi:hypothetical protein
MLARRHFLTITSAMMFPLPAHAAEPVGEAVLVRGPSTLLRANSTRALQEQASLFEGDLVRTGEDAFAQLLLDTATRINLGPQSEIGVDKFIADLGGEITIGGAIVFDRPDDLPKIDLQLRSSFGQIGVRGTRFFAGPSNGSYAVFVDRGAVTVTAGGVTRNVGPGQGVNLAGNDAAPTESSAWGQARIDAAFANVGL